MALPPGVKPEPKTSFSPADRQKALEMLGRGESEETVKSFFKAMGFPHGVVDKEVSALREVKVSMPAEESSKAVMTVVGMAGKKRYTMQWGFAILIVVLLSLLGSILWITLPRLLLLAGMEFEKAPVYWDVSVTTRDCTAKAWAIKVVNAFFQPLPQQVNFEVAENGAPCLPSTSLQPATGGEELTCICQEPGCAFQDGMTYSIRSNFTRPTGDACRFRK